MEGNAVEDAGDRVLLQRVGIVPLDHRSDCLLEHRGRLVDHVDRQAALRLTRTRAELPVVVPGAVLEGVELLELAAGLLDRRRGAPRRVGGSCQKTPSSTSENRSAYPRAVEPPRSTAATFGLAAYMGATRFAAARRNSLAGVVTRGLSAQDLRGHGRVVLRSRARRDDRLHPARGVGRAHGPRGAPCR